MNAARCSVVNSLNFVSAGNPIKDRMCSLISSCLPADPIHAAGWFRLLSGSIVCSSVQSPVVYGVIMAWVLVGVKELKA